MPSSVTTKSETDATETADTETPAEYDPDTEKDVRAGAEEDESSLVVIAVGTESGRLVIDYSASTEADIRINQHIFILSRKHESRSDKATGCAAKLQFDTKLEKKAEVSGPDNGYYAISFRENSDAEKWKKRVLLPGMEVTPFRNGSRVTWNLKIKKRYSKQEWTDWAEQKISKGKNEKAKRSRTYRNPTAT
jgi:hypothetical protein